MGAALLLLLLTHLPSKLCSSTRWGILTVPVADLRSSSTSLPTSYDYDPSQESQLLYGERVKIVSDGGEGGEGGGGGGGGGGDGGDWLKIEAIEQQEYSHAHRWQGYPGWIKKNSVCITKKVSKSNFVVKKKVAYLFSEPDSKSPAIFLSLGTKLNGLKVVKNGFRKVRSPNGSISWIADSDIRPLKPPLPEEKTRKVVIDSASELLGDLYFWGGRSANIHELKDQVTAVDCSGLTNLAYRVAGIEIPRDSYEQFLKARRIKREELKTGDLIFSASKENPGKVSHVSIFFDQENIIEAPKTGERVRKIAFKEKFGIPLAEIQEGSSVGDRFIYFGTYFPN